MLSPSPGSIFRLAARYLNRDPGRGFGGLKGGFVIGGFGALTAQVHLMQPQTPGKIFVHTAMEPRPQWGLGCLPQHGPGGPPLAAAVSAPSRTPMANAAVAAMTAMKNLA